MKKSVWVVTIISIIVMLVNWNWNKLKLTAMDLQIIYLNKIPAAMRSQFESKLIAIANRLQVKPNWLMQVFKAESNVNPAAKNTAFPFKDGYATGLIQFTPDTARYLGTTTEDLAKMSAVGQLDYVYKYLLPYKGRMKDYFGVYLAVFFPAAISRTSNDSYVFETSKLKASSIAKSNPIINQNGDEKITMAEFKAFVIKSVAASVRQYVF